MSRFEYRTLQNSTPKGKPRVYISIHPDDCERYLDMVTNDILAIHNCAIWYETDFIGEFNSENLLSDLMQMQLIVVPVTTKLLTVPSRAIDIEIPFAIEHHIPLLPLMMEDELDEIYKEVFGNVQYLKKHESDTTALPYSQKLSRFLSIVLPSEETITKIQSAFDAYIFLSYRKKDRLHAQELMRLIHKNEVCRGIAIWYDEFLVPGEDFNDTIDAAINKCLLFALAVTPNLINEINYVMTKEYPAAQQRQKSILPAEVISTDRKVLSEKFKNIPHVVDAYDELQMLNGLAPILNKLALHTQKNTPEHTYFIGLAYLMGIDVEVDYAYAEKAIRQAAECGLSEAMTKLVSMYATGEGVKYNLEEAIYWQKRLCESQKPRFLQGDSSEENDIKYVRNVQKLTDLYLSAEHIEEAKQASVSMNEAGLALVNCYTNAHCKRLLAHSYEVTAQVEKHFGNNELALGKFLLAIETYESIKDATDQAAIDISIGRLLCSVAYMLNGQSRYEEANRKMVNALSIFSRLAETSDSYIYIIEQIHSYRFLGFLASELGNAIEAEQHYKTGIELITANGKATKDIGVLDSLRTILKGYARFCEGKGRISEAERLLQRVIEISECCANMTNADHEKHLLIQEYERFSRFLYDAGKAKESKQYHQLALQSIEQLANDTGSIYAKRTWANMLRLDVTGRWHCGGNSRADWLHRFQKASEIYEQLICETHSAKDRGDLAVLYWGFGEMYEEDGNFKEAERYFEQYVSMLAELAEETGKVDYLRMLITAYRVLANFYSRLRDVEKAEKTYDKYIAAARLIASKTKFFSDDRTVASACHYKGSFLRSLRRYDEAISTYKEAAKILETFYKNTNEPDALEELSSTYHLIGFVYEYLKQYDEVEKYYLLSVQRAEQYKKIKEDVIASRELIKCYSRLACFYAKRNRIADSKDVFSKTENVVRILTSEMCNTSLPENLRIVAWFYEDKGKALVKHDSIETGICYAKAEELWQAIIGITNDEQDKKAFARFIKGRDYRLCKN